MVLRARSRCRPNNGVALRPCVVFGEGCLDVNRFGRGVGDLVDQHKDLDDVSVALADRQPIKRRLSSLLGPVDGEDIKVTSLTENDAADLSFDGGTIELYKFLLT